MESHQRGAAASFVPPPEKTPAPQLFLTTVHSLPDNLGCRNEVTACAVLKNISDFLAHIERWVVTRVYSESCSISANSVLFCTFVPAVTA
jgi:hypothetical protein